MEPGMMSGRPPTVEIAPLRIMDVDGSVLDSLTSLGLLVVGVVTPAVLGATVPALRADRMPPVRAPGEATWRVGRVPAPVR